MSADRRMFRSVTWTPPASRVTEFRAATLARSPSARSRLPTCQRCQQRAETAWRRLGAVAARAGRRVDGDDAPVGRRYRRHGRPGRAEDGLAAPRVVGADVVVVGSDARFGEIGVDD